jgi:hypothetical protein
MARSLLSFRFVSVVVLASALSMSACIIPVAPNFQDPPSVPDSPPYVSNIVPTYGEVATFQLPTTTFSAVVNDMNLNASIFYRWVGDYPPNVPGVTWSQLNYPEIKPSLDGLPLKQLLPFDLTCDLVNSVSGTHRVELILADGQFQDTMGLPADSQFDTLLDPNDHIVKITWTVSMSCPASTTSSTSSP